MRQHYPLNNLGAEDAGALPWTDGVPSTGQQGSFPGHAIVTDTEAEILAAIDAAGLVRNGSDLTQLVQAIARGGLWLGQFAGTATALTATLPNAVTVPSLQAGVRVRGIAASNYTGSGGTLAITGIGGAANTVSYPLIGADGVTPLATGAWKAGQFLTFDIDASGNARFGGAAGSGFANVLFTATKTSNQSGLSANTLYDVAWQQPAAGSPPSFASAWDGTNLTISTPGRYLIHAMVTFAIGTSGGYVECDVHLYKNGAALRGGEMTGNPGGTTWYGLPQVFTIVDLAAGDTLKVRGIATATNYSSGAIVAQQADGSNEVDTVLTVLRLS